MAQLVELGLVETLSDSEMKSSGSPGGKTQSMLSSKELLCRVTRQMLYTLDG